MRKEIEMRYDREGDCLEVIFERKAGYFRERTKQNKLLTQINTD